MYGSAEWRARGLLRSEEIARVVLGTAGHIDHGKTALVRALTGVDADRLAEEQSRGMTIDLGFAPLELDGRAVGVVDVPGHERFVKNMVAGATGIDLVLLVVAADDGVMPQTREHLEILSLLGLERGVVAVTKVDRPGVDDDLLAALDAELDVLLAGTFLAPAPRVRVSALTGAGVPALRAVLAREVGRVEQRPVRGPFRMPVQRVFSVKGFGTVLTGIPLSGVVAPGDGLAVHTQRGAVLRARVRGIQAYGRPVERARAGHSAALNFVDVDRKAVVRGDVVAHPDVFASGELWEVRLESLASCARAFDRRINTVRVHLGTAEVMGEVALLEGSELAPGEAGFAQLRLRTAVVAAPGDRFVVRRHSPLETLGGGVILGRSAWRLKAGRPFVLERLARREATLGDLEAQALLALEDARGALAPGSAELLAVSTSLGQPLTTFVGALQSLVDDGRAARARDGRFVTLAEGARLDQEHRELQAQLLERLARAHASVPTRPGQTLTELRRLFEGVEEPRLAAALGALLDRGGGGGEPPVV
ncbi:MAG: selenocysteine-specific translation elongation factor, partial [Planctomycetes bacterium]|nr:selenocysteine-specific translation elongation factor [Planctomycetota bacterium]